MCSTRVLLLSSRELQNPHTEPIMLRYVGSCRLQNWPSVEAPNPWQALLAGSICDEHLQPVHCLVKSNLSPDSMCVIRRLQHWPSVEALPAALHHQRHLHKPSMRRAVSAELPPLRALPPPITLSSLPSVNIDLDVDYQTEVAPFLGTCLVGHLLVIRRSYFTFIVGKHFLRVP